MTLLRTSALMLKPFLLAIYCVGLVLGSVAYSQETPKIEESSEAVPHSNSVGGDAKEKSPFELVQKLGTASFKAKADIIDALVNGGHPRVKALLQYFLDGDLYQRKADGVVVIAKSENKSLRLESIDSGETQGPVDKSDLKKITVNNKLRGQLRDAIARLSLFNESVDVRLAAINDMLKNVSPDALPVLHKVLAVEKNSGVAEQVRLAIALIQLNDSDHDLRLAAVKQLGDSVHPEAMNRLRTLVRDLKGETDPNNAALRQSAERAISKIEGRLEGYHLIETVFFGLSLGSVLLLAAIGLAITFGVMGVINMAHGELIMIGAYTTYVVQLMMPNHIDFSLFVAVPAAFLVAGAVGIAIERGVIRYLYGRPLETLLATFGISLILQQVVRSIFSPLNRSVETPSWMSGAWEINSALALTYNRLYIVLFSLLVFGLLLLLLKRTTFGLNMRAVTQNRSMARAMGIRSGWVDAMTFGLGSGIAGVAGVALSQLTNVGPNLGQAYIIDSFMVVVFGGVGNLWGTLVGAFSLGVVNKFLEPWSGAVLAKIFVLVFIILFIQKRPRGLFPQKGRAAEA